MQEDCKYPIFNETLFKWGQKFEGYESSESSDASSYQSVVVEEKEKLEGLIDDGIPEGSSNQISI